MKTQQIKATFADTPWTNILDEQENNHRFLLRQWGEHNFAVTVSTQTNLLESQRDIVSFPIAMAIFRFLKTTYSMNLKTSK